MSRLDRRVGRRAARAYDQMMSGGQIRTTDEGKQVHVLGSSQVEALAALRALPVAPPAPGSADSDRDDIDPVAYRRGLNARKRARRARRS